MLSILKILEAKYVGIARCGHAVQRRTKFTISLFYLLKSMFPYVSPGPTSSGGTVYPVGAPIPVGLIQNLHVGPSTGAAATRAPAPSARGGAAAAGSRGGAVASGGTPFQRQRPPVPVPMTRGVGPLVSASESPPKSIRLNAPNSVVSIALSGFWSDIVLG